MESLLCPRKLCQSRQTSARTSSTVPRPTRTTGREIKKQRFTHQEGDHIHHIFRFAFALTDVEHALGDGPLGTLRSSRKVNNNRRTLVCLPTHRGSRFGCSLPQDLEPIRSEPKRRLSFTANRLPARQGLGNRLGVTASDLFTLRRIFESTAPGTRAAERQNCG